MSETDDDGPGIPEMERAVLETGEAVDPLYHGSGLGLWLVFSAVRVTAEDRVIPPLLTD